MFTFGLQSNVPAATDSNMFRFGGVPMDGGATNVAPANANIFSDAGGCLESKSQTPVLNPFVSSQGATSAGLFQFGAAANTASGVFEFGKNSGYASAFDKPNVSCGVPANGTSKAAPTLSDSLAGATTTPVFEPSKSMPYPGMQLGGQQRCTGASETPAAGTASATDGVSDAGACHVGSSKRPTTESVFFFGESASGRNGTAGQATSGTTGRGLRNLRSRRVGRSGNGRGMATFANDSSVIQGMFGGGAGDPMASAGMFGGGRASDAAPTSASSPDTRNGLSGEKQESPCVGSLDKGEATCTATLSEEDCCREAVARARLSWEKASIQRVRADDGEKRSLTSQLNAARESIRRLKEEKASMESQLDDIIDVKSHSEAECKALRQRLASQNDLNASLREQLRRAQEEHRHRAKAPTPRSEVVRRLAELECVPLRVGDSQSRAALRKKILFKWHPDKQPAPGHADLATQVVQELQNRPEWKL